MSCNGTVCTSSPSLLGGQKGCPCITDSDCDRMFVCVDGACDFGYGVFGHSCTSDVQCLLSENLKCYNGICKRNVTLGDPCSSIDTGRFCDPTDNGQWSRCQEGFCQTIPGPGEGCTVHVGQDPCPPWHFCARNATDSPHGVCQSKFSLSEGAICSGLDQCLPNLYCNVTLSDIFQGKTGLCTVPTNGSRCTQTCPGSFVGLQECVCGGPNNQIAVCTTPQFIPDCRTQINDFVSCGITHHCPDWTLAVQNGFNNVYDNSCWHRHCQSQLFAWQCCICPLFLTHFRIVGLSCFPTPSYTTPSCCNTSREEGQCVTDRDSCRGTAVSPSVPVGRPPIVSSSTICLEFVVFLKICMFWQFVVLTLDVYLTLTE